MRASTRAQLTALALTDRRSGWPLEMVLAAHKAGLAISEVGIPYRPRVGRSKVTGTLRGTARAVERHVGPSAMRQEVYRGVTRPIPAHVTVIAKAPVAGRVKTRLCPPLTFEQAALVAEAALTDTVTARGDAGVSSAPSFSRAIREGGCRLLSGDYTTPGDIPRAASRCHRGFLC